MLEVIIIPLSYVDPLSVAASFSLGAVTATAVMYAKNKMFKEKKD